jgi:nitrate/TMAO reductase-like tetraheme cytochrome c subunit
MVKQQYIVTCKHCRSLFASEIEVSNESAAIDSVLVNKQETCPNCRKVTKYDPKVDFTFM